MQEWASFLVKVTLLLIWMVIKSKLFETYFISNTIAVMDVVLYHKNYVIKLIVSYRQKLVHFKFVMVEAKVWLHFFKTCQMA